MLMPRAMVKVPNDSAMLPVPVMRLPTPVVRVLLPKPAIVPLLARVVDVKLLSPSSSKPAFTKLPPLAVALKERPCCKRSAPLLFTKLASSVCTTLAAVRPTMEEFAPTK